MADWQFPIIALLLLDDVCGGSCRSQVHSRYRKDFLKSLDIIGRRLRQRKIPRSCLQDPSVSTWHKLYEANNDQGMITLTGFDCDSFASLCAIFAPVFDSYTPFVPSGTSCFEHEKIYIREDHEKFAQKTALVSFLRGLEQGDR